MFRITFLSYFPALICPYTMESAIQQEEPTAPVNRPRKKKSKKVTRFDRRVNWVKDHPVFSWILLIGFISGSLWALIPKPLKDAVNNKISSIHWWTGRDLARLKAVITNYYDNLGTDGFKASDYFAPQVSKYILVSNTTPVEIDAYSISNGLEFFGSKTILFDSTFAITKNKEGNNVVTFWSELTCFRKSKLKYEYCLVQMELIFDANDKIISYQEIEQKGLKFWNKELLFEGSVGKLPAVFTLVFDYMSKSISGTYYYPTREGITYDITGTIDGKIIELVEYTRGKKTATCTLNTDDDKTFTGTMHNTDGRKLNMTMRTSEFLYLE